MAGCDDQMALRLTRAWKCGRSFLECVFGLWALSRAASIKALNKVYSKYATVQDNCKQEDQQPCVFIASFLYTQSLQCTFVSFSKWNDIVQLDLLSA